jgi:hypothetical protein
VLDRDPFSATGVTTRAVAAWQALVYLFAAAVRHMSVDEMLKVGKPNWSL